MFQRIRKHITPSTAIAFLALVFALTGGAFAASSHSSGAGLKATASSTPASVAKSKAKPKAKAGPRGPAGPAGAKGAAGAAGSAGPAGPAGATGAKGESGAPGAKGETGAAGVAGSAGTAGAKGAAGSPWTAGGILPSNATETGSWSFGYWPSGSNTTFFRVPISFQVPLSGGLSGAGCETIEPSPQPHVAETCQVHFINAAGKEAVEPGEEVTSTACAGSAASPTATPGNLCVYTAKLETARAFNHSINSPGDATEATGTATAGAYIKFENAEEESQGWGTWAVTGE